MPFRGKACAKGYEMQSLHFPQIGGKHILQVTSLHNAWEHKTTARTMCQVFKDARDRVISRTDKGHPTTSGT